MIAVAMPLFVFIDFLDHTVAWLEANPLAVLVFVAGLLACGFLALLWHDTRYDDDAPWKGQVKRPPVQKIVQITGVGPRLHVRVTIYLTNQTIRS